MDDVNTTNRINSFILVKLNLIQAGDPVFNSLFIIFFFFIIERRQKWTMSIRRIELIVSFWLN